MILRLLVLTLGGLLLLVACQAEEEEVPPAAETPTLAALPPNITSVSPADGASIAADQLARQGVCVSFNFRAGNGMGDRPTALIQMSLDEQNVSRLVQWITTEDLPPSSGGGCYTPRQPLSAGEHSAEVTYRDAADEEYQYSWQFTVTE